MTACWSLAETRGFSLFPLVHLSKRPAVRSWDPYKIAPAPAALVDQWSEQATLNMAVATGAVSGCFVLDADNLMARIEAESRGLPPTFTVRTPRGTHFYFNHPGWEISNRAGTLDNIDGLDLRGDGGYVVGPGSYFVPSAAEIAKGKIEGAYVVEHDVPLADAPDWLLALTIPKHNDRPSAPHVDAEETTPYGRGALNSEIAKLIDCPSGRINDQINLSAFKLGQLRAGGEITDEEGWGALMEALATMGLGGEDKANGTVLRGWEAGLQYPRAVERKQPADPMDALGTRAMTVLDDVPPPPAPGFGPPSKPQFIGGNDLLWYFDGVVYVTRRNEMFLPSGVMVKSSSFNGLYGGPTFIPEIDGGKPTKSAWQMFCENAHIDMPKVWDVCFRPEMPPGQIVTIEGLPYLNIFVPIVTPRAAGDPTPFLTHIKKMLPDERDVTLLLHWMASAVQNPGKKFFWWPVIQGTKGNGKSMLLEVMIRAIGERYSHMVRADAVLKTGNQFNDWLVGKLFLGFGEIRSSEGKRDFVEIMKDTVTDKRVATEGKGLGQSTSDNRANGMMLSNWRDSCPIDDDERRWGVFFTAQQKAEDIVRDGMDGEYFPRLYDWLDNGGYAIVTHYLATFPLVAALDPAREMHRAPETTSTADAITESLGLVEQELQEAIETGAMGFRGGVATSTGLRGVLSALRKTITPKRFTAIMESIGYVRHPALESNKWRAHNALSDGSRPVLYFTVGHELLALTDPVEIKEGVEAALIGNPPMPSNVVPIRR